MYIYIWLYTYSYYDIHIGTSCLSTVIQPWTDGVNMCLDVWTTETFQSALIEISRWYKRPEWFPLFSAGHFRHVLIASWRSLGKFQKMSWSNTEHHVTPVSSCFLQMPPVWQRVLSTPKFDETKLPTIKTNDNIEMPQEHLVSGFVGAAVPMFSCLNRDSPSSELLGLRGWRRFWPSKSCGIRCSRHTSLDVNMIVECMGMESLEPTLF